MMRPVVSSITAGILSAVCAVAAFAQPVCFEQRITANPPFFGGRFGEAVAISGGSTIVGRPTLSGIGSAFSFHFSQSTGWIQTQHLIPPDGAGGDHWGLAVAIQGDVAAIASRTHTHAEASGSGAVWILRRIGGQWAFEQELLAPTGTELFGIVVEFDDDRLVVSMSGGVLLYRSDGSSWTLEQSLFGSAGFCYGCAVAIDGDVLVVGSSFDNTHCLPPGVNGSSGLVYVYRNDGKQWVEEQVLSPSDPGCMRRFGTSVAVSGDTIIATAPVSPPSAYVFEYDKKTQQWIESAVLHPPDFGAISFGFGDRQRSVAIERDTVVVGAWSSHMLVPGAGAAFVYRRLPDGTWTAPTTLLPQPNATGNAFGWAVAIDQGRLIVGAHGEDGGRGAAYIYRLAPPGDFNCDGLVNGLDLGILLINWSIPPGMPGCNGAAPCPADLNADGVVNGLDLGLLLAGWTIN